MGSRQRERTDGRGDARYASEPPAVRSLLRSEFVHEGGEKPLTEAVRANRTPASPDNPLLAMEKAASSWITTCLESWGSMRGGMTEAFFLNAYGLPLLQAMRRAR